MKLENVFQEKVEKLPEEKKLEVIESEGSIRDKSLVELRVYFEQSILPKFEMWSERFKAYKKHLQHLTITPTLITKMGVALPVQKPTIDLYKEYKGIFLSAMIQTSYNQGFNDFKFEETNSDYFCAYLKGQPQNPIKITAETLKGNYSWWLGKNCSLKTKTLKGDLSLYSADNCSAEITNYQGREFGFYMENCIIKSGNKETLETIKKQLTHKKNNKFELIK